MPQPGWLSISLKKEMIQRIQKFVDSNPELGFKSVPDLVASVVNEYLIRRQDLETNYKVPYSRNLYRDIEIYMEENDIDDVGCAIRELIVSSLKRSADEAH